MPNNKNITYTAIIREEECIGCGKCLPVCPVDAILGAPRLMHTVLTDYCIGCKLCLAPCPVDCISLEPLPLPEPALRLARAATAKQRYQIHKNRRQKAVVTIPAASDRQAEIAAILARKKKVMTHECSQPPSTL